MKQHILPFVIGLCWVQTAFSQPIVLVKGTEDSLALKTLIIQYLDELDIRGNVHLSVSFTTQLPDAMEGLTICVDNSIPHAYQVIRVRIDNRLNKIQQRWVLAHEMIHVKQFAKGELMTINRQQMRWKGRRYWCLEDHRRSTPWEREACQMGKILARLDLQPEVPLVAVDKNH